MPKDEFDFEDPLELNGMAFLTHEDTTDDMAECFIEEFMRMGYGHKQILALFRNAHYLGPNLAFERRGERFIRDVITEVFARRGKAVSWPDPESSQLAGTHASANATESQSLFASTATAEGDEILTDPMGAPAPNLNI
jgi:hypothetical protein